MAKKKPSTKKKTASKPAKKAAKKPTAKKPVAKKASASKPKPVTKKKAETVKKKPAPKAAAAPAAKPSASKPTKAPKPSAKSPAKPAAETPAPKADAAAKGGAKTSKKSAGASKLAAAPKGAKAPAPAAASDSKPAKGAKSGGKTSRASKPRLPVKSDEETFAEAQAAAARLAAIAGIRPIESRPFDDPNAADNSKRLTKSPLSKKEMGQYKELLLRKRAEIMGDVESMEDEALMAGDRMSHTPNHMAEQGSDVYGQTLSLDIAASQRKLVVEIEQALQRIEEGTYGICVTMGVPIGKARLDAKPWAKHCIEAARRMERGGSLA